MTTPPSQHPKPRVTCRARPSLADDSRFDSLPLRCVPAAVGICSYRLLAARGETPAAFGRRCIPADCVAPPSHMADMLGRRALSAGRLAGLVRRWTFTTDCYRSEDDVVVFRPARFPFSTSI